MDGWIKLHRCLLNKAIWKNNNLFRVWMWCLMKATHKSIETMVGMTKIILEPGQFIFGRKVASKETGIAQSTVVDCMRWLETNQSIVINPTTKYSVVTVINWSEYQSKECSSDNNPTTVRQQPDNNPTQTRTLRTKECKNINIPCPVFERFYSEYPKKEGRCEAEKAWKKISPSEHEAILQGVEKYKIHVQDTERRYIKMPASWLNSKRWLDVYGGDSPAKNTKRISNANFRTDSTDAEWADDLAKGNRL